MIVEYINAALKKAQYEILEDQTFYGEIPDFEGCYANESTLEDCRNELASVLEDWILFSLNRQLLLPVVDGLALEVKKVA